MPRFRITALSAIEVVAFLHPPGATARIEQDVPASISLSGGDIRDDIALVRRVRAQIGSAMLDVVPHPSALGQAINPGGLIRIELLA
jgi:hypothetical protein